MRWPRIFSHSRAERDLEDELAIHLELQIRKHLADGLSEADARRRARLEFGSLEKTREELRDRDRWRVLDSFARHFKQSVQALARSPGYTVISILILAAGIGSNLAVFSTLDALLFRPLPVERPGELVRISTVGDHGDLLEIPSNGLPVLEVNRALAGVCGVSTSLPAVEIERNTEERGVGAFTGNCFHTLGLRLALGRALTAGDDAPGAPGVAVITDRLWRSAFGRRPDILGMPLQIHGALYTIVGVTAGRFSGLLLGFPENIIIPLHAQPDLLASGRKPDYYEVNVLARRAPGVSEAAARASILTQRTQLLSQSVPHRYNAAQRKEYLARPISVVPGQTGIDYFLRNRFGPSLYAVFGICAALLLIAAVNLSSLLVARGLRRRQEVAIRLALGAQRRQIAQLFAAENALLVVTGALLGVWVGLATTRLLLAAGAAMFGNFHLDTGLDSRVLAFLIALVALVFGCFALASVWQAGRLAKPEGRGVIAGQTRVQKMLLGTQIALTLAFVASSALFAASLRNMYRIDLGINTDHLWDVMLAEERPNHFDPANYYRGLLGQIESLPSVQSASLTNFIPFFNYDERQKAALVENGRMGGDVGVRDLGVSDHFLGTLGAKIIAGDDFRRNDAPTGEPTAIVSESLARHLGRHFKNPRDLLGHHLRLGDEAEYQHLKVIGIASDTDLSLVNLAEQKPFTIYLNYWQHRDLEGYPVLEIRTRGGALPLAAIRRIVKQKGYEYVSRVSTIRAEMDGALIENRFLAYLSGAFGLLALVMAAVGLFGLLSYQVANRTNEIGIRLALGAPRRQIQWLILQQVLGLLVLGVVSGVGLTLALARTISSLLFGVTAYDAPLLLISIAVLASTAIVAAWLPIRRASAIDPLQALRHE